MTRTHHTPRRLPATLLAALAVLATMITATAAHANTPPIKLIPTSTIENGFQYAEGVAVNNDPTSPTYDNVYVPDPGNRRVQELTAGGVFVSMFGYQVNKTRTEAINAKGGTPTQAEIEEENICTAASKDICQAGTEGEAPGQFGNLTRRIASDPASGDLYIAEEDGRSGRLQEFTAEGRFVLEVGQEVNAKTKGNICTREEMEKDGVQCAGPAPLPGPIGGGVAEPDTFVFNGPPATGLVTIGGPEDLIYVGDEHRVQELETDGKYKREIPLTAISAAAGSGVGALAVNETTGDVYLVYPGEANTIREFDLAGQEVTKFSLSPRSPAYGYPIQINSLSVDSSGRVAVGEEEYVNGLVENYFGSLLEGSSGRLVTEFSVPGAGGRSLSKVSGSAFGPHGEMYAVKTAENDVVVYRPVPVAELTTSMPVCSPGVEAGSDVTFGCTLGGEVNPEGVAGTEVFFDWGRTSAFGEVTAKQSVGSVEPVSTLVRGLVPNETYFDKLVGEDENSMAPEFFAGEIVSFTTPSVAPKVVGAPGVLFVTPFSALFSGALNPENANTAYEFQYGACEDLDACPGTLSTRTLQSAAYGQVTALLEARGLKPGTVYHYRLLASSPGGATVTGATGVFTTGPAPVVQASSGSASDVGTTSATISGSVDPDGQPAVYTFEVGLYEGAGTQYGVVFTATTAASMTAVPESVVLSGLQPGRTYAYRVKIASGYGTAYGETLTFTTQGLPAVLAVPATPALLPVPAVAFPNPSSPVKSKPRKKTSRSLKVCKKKGRGGRTVCERRAGKRRSKSKGGAAK